MRPNETQALALLDTYVQTKSKTFTLSDAASVTGMPVLETEYALKSLMLKYNCRLKVTEKGDLIYDFGDDLELRGSRPWSEYFWAALEWSWWAFTIVGKIVTACILVVYFIVFLVIIICLIIAAIAGADGDADAGSSIVGDFFGGLFHAFVEIFSAIANHTAHSKSDHKVNWDETEIRIDKKGNESRHYKERVSSIKKTVKHDKTISGHAPKDKGFVAAVCDFIFGPARVHLPDPLQNQRELATYLRENKGIVCTSELQHLTGLNREDAENLMTACLADFDGKAEISENGTLYGDFQELIRSKDRTGEEKVTYYYNEYEPPYELTGNSGWTNFGIICMNVFNVICAGVAISYSETPPDDTVTDLIAYSESMDNIAIWLGDIPLLYSLMVFTLPLLRLIPIWYKQSRVDARNLHKQLIKTIFAIPKPEISLEALTKIHRKTIKNDSLTEAEFADLIQPILHEYDAESFVDANGKFGYKFERLFRELGDVRELRKNKNIDTDLGNELPELS